AALREAFARQTERSRLRRAPALMFCRRVAAPAVVGILKPVVLLPLSIAADMSLGQIELLLAHELAHIRRRDPLLDLLERIVEAFFFFHPAVWFLSRAIRLEREKCCDDLVVGQANASRLPYAAA